MTISHALRLVSCLAMLGASAAQAAISCAASASPVQSTYFENDTNPTDGTWSVTINCTRGSSDPSTSAYTLTANDGLDPGGGAGMNRATNGTGASNRIEYDLFRVAPGSGTWGATTTTDFDGTINFGTALSASTTLTFYSRIAAGQNKNAKLYSDTVAMTLSYNNGTSTSTSTSNISVSIENRSVCLVTSPPSTMSFNYTSFQATNATASSSYKVRCTLNETYTMSLDASSGTLLNLTYTLTLSNPEAGRTGTGFEETFSISGSIAAGQSGTCATGVCTAPQTRTLTVTY